MYGVHWKALVTVGLGFWGLLYFTDLLGESTWKKCSIYLDDVLQEQYNEMLHRLDRSEDEGQKTPIKWPSFFWNVCAFICSLVFCTLIKSMSWIIRRIYKIYNMFKTRTIFSGKSPDPVPETKANCQVLYKNKSFNSITSRDITKELESVKKERNELTQQVSMLEKENVASRAQIEEYKLESFMMKEKLARTANTLKENLKHKDFANANQELLTRKYHSLELHLKEVCKDRDNLRSKLAQLEKHCSKMEDKLRVYEKIETFDSEANLDEEFPEKDVSTKPSGAEESEIGDTVDMDICKFQKKIMLLQKTIGTYESKRPSFEANSKISMEVLEESRAQSGVDLCRDTYSPETINDCKAKTDIDIVKQNILNYNAYKAQMLRPKLRLENIKERLYPLTDTTGSSSEDVTGPHRIISSTAEFQNFLKSLNSNSTSSVNI